MRRSLFSQTAFCFLTITILSDNCRADFAPIILKSDSFNQDVVVEKTAPPPVLIVTTASMDTGLTNTGFSWFEQGFNPFYPTTGLPAPSSVITSDASTDHSFQFAGNYKSNNAVLIDATLANPSVNLTAPSKAARLSFLLASGSSVASLGVTIHHQDSTTETATLPCPDWMIGAGPAYQASGRINVRSFAFDGVPSSYPRLFSKDIALANTNSAVTSIDFNYVGGEAHVAVFGVSSCTNLVDAFTPLSITGYNADLIVEASATRPQSLGIATSASMEGGTENAGRTWYERGYYPPEPNTGLPAAGSLLTNNLALDHVFALPPSYTTNNALLVDSIWDSGVLTPFSPSAYAALSFLCASGHGPVTNLCVVQHANGLSESNNIIIADWFDNSPAAFIAYGDLNLNNRMVDSVGANNPKLYAVDVALANSTSPVTNVLFVHKGGAANSHAAIFALSGFAPQGSGVRPSLTISRLAGGNLRISTSQAGQLQSTTALKGSNTVWQYEGIISSALDLAPTTGISGKYYRVIGQ